MLRSTLETLPGYAPALVIQARLEAADKKTDRAVASIEKALASEPSNVEALHVKGDILIQSKADFDGAIDIYRKALAIDPNYFPARVSLINLLFSKNDVAAIEPQIDVLRKTHPNHPQTLYLDAQFAYSKKDYKKAGELIQKFLSTSSGSALAFTGRCRGAAEPVLCPCARLSRQSSAALSIAGQRTSPAGTELRFFEAAEKGHGSAGAFALRRHG